MPSRISKLFFPECLLLGYLVKWDNYHLQQPQNMEEGPGNTLKDRLYKHFPAKKPGTTTFPTLNPALTQKTSKETVLIPRIKIDRKIPPLNKSLITFKEARITSELSPQPRRKEHLKEIEANELSQHGKTLLQLRKTLQNKGLMKDEKNVGPTMIFDFFKSFPYMCQDFFYLNKRSHPYDYHVVEFRDKNPEEYMTISCKGVTQFINKKTYFLSQEDWLVEERMYHNLQKIDFFKNYKINKNFRIWRNMMKRHHLEDISNTLNDKLFVTIIPSRKAILSIRNECLQFEESCRMFMTDMRDTFEIEKFESVVREFQRGPFLQIIRNHEETVVSILSGAIKEWINKYKEENNIESKDGKSYNYSRKALLRMQHIKISHLIKLVQAILKDSKLNMVVNNIELLLSHLRNIGDEQREESIICHVDWEGKRFVWSPDKNKFKNVFIDFISHAIKVLSDDSHNLEELDIFSDYKVEEEHPDSKKEEKRSMFSICTEDERYKAAVGDIIEELSSTFDNFTNEEAKLLDFVDIYERHPSKEKLTEDMNTLTAAELRIMIKEYKLEQTKMQTMDEKLEKGLIFLDYSKLRNRIVNVPTESLNTLISQLHNLFLKKASSIQATLQRFSNELSVFPNNVDKFVVFMKCVNNIGNYLQDLSCQSNELVQLVNLMEEQKISTIERYKSKSKEVSQGIQSLKEKIDEFYAGYDQNLNKFKRELEASAAKVDCLVDELISKFQNVPLNKKDSSINDIISYLEENRKLADQVNAQALRTNELETELGIPNTGFEKVRAFYKQFDLMNKLWIGRKGWYDVISDVKEKHFLAVNTETLSSFFHETIQLAEQLENSLEEDSEVATTFRQEISSFESVIQTLNALHDPFLREEHEWIEIPEFIHHKTHPESNEELKHYELPLYNRKQPIYTVNWLIQHGIHQWHQELMYFGTKAAKENQLSEVINQTKKFLNEAQILFVLYKDSKDVYRLSSDNASLFLEIEEKVMGLYNIMSNKYSQNLHEKVEPLIKQFQYLQELFEEMLVHERHWSLIEPILSSASSKVLTKELKEFATCDTQWKRVTKNLRENPTCVRIANDYVNRQHVRAISKNNAVLQQIHKSLDDFLDKKRVTMPRLYLISNHELISMMSEAHTVRQASPFLYKLFAAVKELEFDKDMPTGIISFDDEVVHFKQFGIRPQGEIEEVLKVIEEQIKKSMSGLFKTLLPKYDEEEISLQALVCEYPSQVANIVDWITWTKIGENYLGPEPIGELFNWLEVQEEQIRQIACLLSREDLKHRHKAIRSLLVQSLYLKESTQSMIKKEVSSTRDYNWLKIVKFSAGHTAPEVYMSQFGAKLGYGFEFQLIGSPLIITPTCERQILNLTEVIQSKCLPTLVGSPCTGKTETLRGLSLMLGTNLVLCNCDSVSNLRVMQRLILAACSTGSWIVFEQYDELTLSTMSVLASMVSTVFKGLVESKQSIVLNKSNISLSQNTAMFLSTVHPKPVQSAQMHEYQRVVSFQAIEQEHICRILLNTYGFKDSSRLASLIEKVVTFVNESTSDWSHHLNLTDYKQIVMHMVDLDKTQFQTEDHILAHSLNELLVSRLRFGINRFEAFLATLHLPSSSTLLLTQQNTFKDFVAIKSAVVVYGESISGKTTFINKINQQVGATLRYITLSSLELGEMVGSNENRIQGVLTTLPRDSWIVFDGSLDTIESIYTQMQPDYISLQRGEIILNKNLKLIFETEDLSAFPPNLLGRMGLLSLNETFDMEGYLNDRMKEVTNAIIPLTLTKTLQVQLLSSFKKIISSKKSYKFLITANDNSVLITCCNNLITFCNSFSCVFKEKDTKETKKMAERIVGWCLIWSVGRMVNEETAPRFQKLMGEIIKPQNQPSGSLFNYFLSPKSCQWIPWQATYQKITYIYTSLSNIYIPNCQSNCLKFFISDFISHSRPFLVVGEAGTGRSAVVKNCLKQLKSEHKLYCLPVLTSKRHKSSRLQSLIEGDMQEQKLNDNNYLVPIAGKRFVVQIEELHMESSSEVELLRSIVSHKGVYDRKSYKWKEVKDLTIAAMGRVKNNQEPYKRFSNLLNIFVKKSSRENMVTIFNKMVELWYTESELKESIFHLLEPAALTKTTLDIMQNLRDTQRTEGCPWQVSYKDVSCLFSMMMESKLYNISKPHQIVRVWAYEMMRSLGDRIPNQQQRAEFSQLIKKKAFIDLKCNLNDNFCQPETLFTSRILSIDYEESSLGLIQNQIEKKLESNEKNSILMFREIIDHIARLSRGVDQQNSHFMMLGSKGVGKKSIAEFSCYLLDLTFETSSILRNETAYLNTLVKVTMGEQVCILITEEDLRDVEVMFLIKSIVCQSIQPLSFSKEQLDLLSGEINSESGWKSQDSLRLFFEKAYGGLHLVFSLAPSEWVKNLLRQESWLVRNCTVDYVDEWPEPTFIQLTEMNLLETFNETEKGKLSRLSYRFYNACLEMVKGSSRVISAKHYLQVISLFNSKYQTFRNEIEFSTTKLTRALSYVADLKRIVGMEESNIHDLEAQVVSVAGQKEVLGQRIVTQESQLRLLGSSIDLEDAEYVALKKQFGSIYEKKVKVVSTLKKSNQILNSISSKDILLLSSTGNNLEVRSVLQMSAILLKEGQEWEHMSKVFLSNTSMMSRLKIVEVSSCSIEMLTQLANHMNSIETLTENLTNSTLNILVKWFLGFLDGLHQHLNLCGDEKALVDGETKKSIEQLAKEQELSALQLISDNCNYHKDIIDFDLKNSKKRIQLCKNTLSSLEAEITRWNQLEADNKKKSEMLINNLFLACNTFKYLGIFDETERTTLMDTWQKILKEEGVEWDANYLETLFDPYEVELVKNYTSQNFLNCIVMLKSPGIPYLLDPNRLSVNFLKQNYPNIRVLRYQEQGYIKTLEYSIKNGIPLILEYSYPHLDPTLIEIALKSTDEHKTIQIADISIQYSQNFKLFILNPREDPMVSSDVYIHCPVIQFNLYDRHIAQELSHILQLSLFPEEVLKLNQQMSDLIANKVRLQKKEDLLMGMIESLNIDATNIDEMLQEYATVQAQKKTAKEDIHKLENSTRQLNLKISQFHHLVETSTKLFSVLVREFGEVLPLKKMRRVFCDCLTRFDASTFIKELINETHMKLLYSVGSQQHSRVNTLYAILALNQDTLQDFDKVWELFSSVGRDDEVDVMKKAVAMGVITEEIKERILQVLSGNNKGGEHPTGEVPGMTPIQQHLESVLLKRTIPFPTTLSKVDYILRAILEPNPIILVSSSDTYSTILRLSGKLSIPQSSILFIHSQRIPQLEQEQISKYKWFVIENCDNQPQVPSFVEVNLRQDHRFFLLYDFQANVPKNIYSTSKVQVWLDETNTLVDTQTTHLLLDKYSHKKTCPGLILAIIDLFNHINKEETCCCSMMSVKDVEGAISAITGAYPCLPLSLHNLRQSIGDMIPCNNPSHVEENRLHLTQITSQSISYEHVEQRLPLDLRTKLSE